MEKWAAIDIGSNTVQLLVTQSTVGSQRAEVEASREKDGLPLFTEPLFHALHTTRLGASSTPNQLAAERVADTLAVLKEYRNILLRQEVAAVRVIATSAVRDATNKDVLIQAVRELCGWQVEVLSGQEEAHISFLGAAEQALKRNARHFLLLDIGGGSSELIRWRDGLLNAVSANVGAVRAQMAHWQANEIERELSAVIKAKDDDITAYVLGAGGTITTAAAILLGCREYSREAVDGYCLKAENVDELLEMLRPLSISERCAFLPLLARRGEIIWEGLLILRAFFRLLSLPCLTVSAGGVLQGCLLDLKQRGLSPMNRIDEGKGLR